MLMGLLAWNMSTWTLESYNPVWGGYCESFTLMIILARGALELEFKGGLIWIGLLAFIPSLFEVGFDFLLIFLAIDTPAMIALSFAISMSAVGPAIVVPLMIDLVKKGYGLKKQIPIKIIASSTIENVTMLVLFGIFSSIATNNISTSPQNPGI